MYYRDPRAERKRKVMRSPRRKMHVFESKGLGKAPFELVEVKERRGPAGEYLGACDCCGRSIIYCCKIGSADGKLFVVGSTCVKKTKDSVLGDNIQRELDRLRLESEEKALCEFHEVVLPTIRERVDTLPPPSRSPEISLGAYYDWMVDNAGHKGRVRAMKTVKAAIAEAKRMDTA